ncbi:nucleotidyltransferase [Oceanobacillus kapialis]|uniref:nucleotidyltransferase n=1 Tax=Oceanobacillus kapialis TaxID=481353 RepID=UPI00384D5EFB
MMQACGLIVEYNPFHNGHVYHIQEAQKASNADCMIAVMSGNFLQRGEPAIMDKFARTKAALLSGIDIMLELPFGYAVQSSELFSKGAVHTLNEIGVSSICFGSEAGNESDFIKSYYHLQHEEESFHNVLKQSLNKGYSFPEASRIAYEQIGLSDHHIDLTKPNNILGYSYVSTILSNHLNIKPLTIERTSSGYHDQAITGSIASATSIRKAIHQEESLTPQVSKAIPAITGEQLTEYRNEAGLWHTWENYFNLLQYRVMTMSLSELASIHGVEEGLEYRIKKTAPNATSFMAWIEAIKTKRYTWTRLQRIFVFLLANIKKTDIEPLRMTKSVPYIRLLGLTSNGQAYLNKVKKQLEVPLISKLSRQPDPLLQLEERASNAYYSVLPLTTRQKMRKQELKPPILIGK